MANAALTQGPLVVLMGDSLTDGWDDADQVIFDSNNYACRGIEAPIEAPMEYI